MPNTPYLNAKNNAQSVLLTTMDTSGTLVAVGSGTQNNFPPAFPFPLTIDNEIMAATGTSITDTFVVTRAAESTSAAAHQAGAGVYHNDTAKMINDLNLATDPLFRTSGSAGLTLFVNSSGSATWGTAGGAAWRFDQTPTGTVNGTNGTFVVPDGQYISGSLGVTLNGQWLTHTADYLENTGGTFTFITAPATGAVVRAHYLLNSSPFANADTVDGFHASSTPTASTILPLNGSGVYPQSVLATTNLGYAQITTNQTGITTNIDITGLSVTVTVPAGGRSVRLTAFCEITIAAAGNNDFIVYIMEGSTILTQNEEQAVTSHAFGNYAQIIFTPTAGAHTYKVQGAASSTAVVNAPSTAPCYLLAELL